MPKYIDAEKIKFNYLPSATLGDQFVTKSEIMAMPAADEEEIVRYYETQRHENLLKEYGWGFIELVRCPSCQSVVPNLKHCGNCGVEMNCGAEMGNKKF